MTGRAPETSGLEAGLAARHAVGLLGPDGPLRWNFRPELERVLAECPPSTVQTITQPSVPPQLMQSLPRSPVVFSGLMDGWAATSWTPASLTERFGSLRATVGTGQEGEAVVLEIQEFFKYCSGAAAVDGNPLYLFQHLGDSATPSSTQRAAECVAAEYAVPEPFTDDLFDCLPAAKRPAHRWLICGAAGSGSSVHQDPLHTCAWNSLIFGRKLWVLFPPDTAAKDVKVDHDIDASVAQWFAQKWPPKPRLRPVVIVQHPGETVYVPAKWWHAVLNLELSAAVTQNFACREHVTAVWEEFVLKDPKVARVWLKALGVPEPGLDSSDSQNDSSDDVDDFGFQPRKNKRRKRRRKDRSSSDASDAGVRSSDY